MTTIRKASVTEPKKGMKGGGVLEKWHMEVFSALSSSANIYDTLCPNFGAPQFFFPVGIGGSLAGSKAAGA
jgi:hypothetical protein